MLGPYAEVEDVRSAWLSTRPLPTDDTVIQYWIDRATRVLVNRVPNIEELITSGRTTRDIVADVVVDLVTEVLRNPDRLRSIQETNGPTSGGVTFAGDAPGALVLTAQHLKDLGVTRGNMRRAGTVPTWG